MVKITTRNDIDIIVTDSKNSINWFRNSYCYYGLNYNNVLIHVLPFEGLFTLTKNEIEFLSLAVVDALKKDYESLTNCENH